MATANRSRHPTPEMMFGSDEEVSEQLRRTTLPFALAVTFKAGDEHLAYERVFRELTT